MSAIPELPVLLGAVMKPPARNLKGRSHAREVPLDHNSFVLTDSVSYSRFLALGHVGTLSVPFKKHGKWRRRRHTIVSPEMNQLLTHYGEEFAAWIKVTS